MAIGFDAPQPVRLCLWWPVCDVCLPECAFCPLVSQPVTSRSVDAWMRGVCVGREDDACELSLTVTVSRLFSCGVCPVLGSRVEILNRYRTFIFLPSELGFAAGISNGDLHVHTRADLA